MMLASDENVDIAGLLAQQIAAAEAVAEAASANLSTQREIGALLREALANEDMEAAKQGARSDVGIYLSTAQAFG